jgi:urea carboxylase-associated protein 2
MSDLDTMSPEEHRARYEVLRAAAAGRARPASASAAAEPEGQILHAEKIPAGWYWSRKVFAGEVLRLINVSGRASAALQIWNAADPAERFNAGDTVKLQWSAILTTERLLFSDMGRVLAAIIRDGAGGRHDVLAGGSTPHTNAQKYGNATLRNTRDNFRLAAAKFGFSKRDVHPCLTFFAGVRTDDEGALAWTGDGQPGEFVDLRAEMPVIITVSNCPHPLNPSPTYDPGELEVLVMKAGKVAEDDVCQNSCEEAVRGYDNTKTWLSQNRGASA